MVILQDVALTAYVLIVLHETRVLPGVSDTPFRYNAYAIFYICEFHRCVNYGESLTNFGLYVKSVKDSLEVTHRLNTQK